DARASCLAQGRIELVARELGPSHHLLEQLSVVGEDLRVPFDDGLQLLASVRNEAHEEVQAHESGRGDETVQQGVVACVHRVLDGVRQNQKQNEIERGQLTYLPLSGDAQEREKEGVDDDAPENQLPPGYGDVPHVVVLAWPTNALRQRRRG